MHHESFRNIALTGCNKVNDTLLIKEFNSNKLDDNEILSLLIESDNDDFCRSEEKAGDHLSLINNSELLSIFKELKSEVFQARAEVNQLKKKINKTETNLNNIKKSHEKEILKYQRMIMLGGRGAGQNISESDDSASDDYNIRRKRIVQSKPLMQQQSQWLKKNDNDDEDDVAVRNNDNNNSVLELSTIIAVEGSSIISSLILGD